MCSRYGAVRINLLERCVMNNDQCGMFANHVHALVYTPVGQEYIPASGATPLFIQPEVEMILSHSGAFPLCTCVFRVVSATVGPLLHWAGPPRPDRCCA